MAHKAIWKTSVKMGWPHTWWNITGMGEDVNDIDDQLNLEEPAEESEHNTDLQLSEDDNDDAVETGDALPENYDSFYRKNGYK